MSRFAVFFGILFAFTLLNTSLLLGNILEPSGVSFVPNRGTNPSLLYFLESQSLISAPAGWVAITGVWVWRGRVRAEWKRFGLDKEVFRIVMKMKGSQARISILGSLLVPRDRFQLAKELNLDWTTVDHHVRVLLKYELIQEHSAYGNVKIYELTGIGKKLLAVLEELIVQNANVASPSNNQNKLIQQESSAKFAIDSLSLRICFG